MGTRKVRLSSDHIARQAQCSPERAIEELIWNGLDAGSPSVDVSFSYDALGSVVAINVRDGGTGIAFSDLERAFGTMGQSLKLERYTTGDGRAMHGSEGRGRFRALVLGSSATWSTTFHEDGKSLSYSIRIDRATEDNYSAGDPSLKPDLATGTNVKIEGVDKGRQSLIADSTIRYLTQRFALYLKRYPAVIRYAGSALDVNACIKHFETFQLDETSTLDVVEWTFQAPRQILVCDTDGFAWHEVPIHLPARDLSFTAFLRCPEAREWYRSGEFQLGELSSDIKKRLDAARRLLKVFVRERLAHEAQELVQQWKEEKIYPYSEDEPQSTLGKAERQVFDIVATSVQIHHPSFSDSARDFKRFTLQLVRQALESNPHSLRKILEEVLNLPHQKQDELAALFEYTNLGGLITASNDVTRRLRAIEGFDEILHGAEWRKTLRERTQLHRLLVRHLWIFGDEYTLDTDDENLEHVLAQHLKHLGRDKLVPTTEVHLINGRTASPT